MKERKMELDVIRIISCFFVIVNHVAGRGMETMSSMTLNGMIRNLITCGVQCAVPMFFMLSGILFMKKEVSIKVLYTKYIFRILIAWSFWSALYAAIDYIANIKTGKASLGYFFSQFIMGHFHMWFLAAILTVYIFLPVLQKLVVACSEEFMKYLAVVILVGVIGKETLEPFLESPTWNTAWGNLNMLGGSVSVVYFVLGYYLYENYHHFSTKVCAVLYGISVVIMAGINVVCSYLEGRIVMVADGYLSLGILVSSSALFMLLLQILSKRDINETYLKCISKISEHTFGIYLVHMLFLEQVYRRIGLTQDCFPVVISIILFSVMTFVLSFIVSWGLRKVPIVGKWIA